MKNEILNPVISEDEARNMIDTWRRGKGKPINAVWKEKSTAPTGAVRKRDFNNIKLVNRNGIV